VPREYAEPVSGQKSIAGQIAAYRQQTAGIGIIGWWKDKVLDKTKYRHEHDSKPVTL
jgi:hypothetical protein